MRAFAFTAWGVPQPKGSTKAFIPKGWKRAIVTSANPKNKGWQQIVAEAAGHAIETHGLFVFGGPVAITAEFYLPRPKALKNKPAPHTKKPDLDKLLRSLKDALTSVVWKDDSQVVSIRAWKHYANVGEAPHVDVTVEDR